MKNKKTIVPIVICIVIIVGVVFLIVKGHMPEYDDYKETEHIVDKVEFDQPIDEIGSQSLSIDDNTYSLSNLPSNMQELVVLGAEIESTSVNCYYAYTKLIGKVKSMEQCDLLVSKTYEGYRCKYYTINGSPVLFIYNDTEIYIDSTQ